jgi:PRTRC genetic system ThiF family protein
MTQSNLLTQTASPVTLRVPDFKKVTITLVGCGGTGSHTASGLVSIAQALRDKSIGVEMVFIDPDRVEVKNVGRQLFSVGDVGEAKAEVLAGRLNAAFGERIMSAVRGVEVLDLTHVPSPKGEGGEMHIAIGAVDNAAARAVIAEAVKGGAGRLWWLDCGNENHSGQVCLGNVTERAGLRGAIALGTIDRLPAPSVVWPDLVKKPSPHPSPKGRVRKAPSCAELTATGEQSLMINRLVAGWALAMLHDLLVTRDLRYFAVALDQQWGQTRSYAIDAPTIAEACGLKPDEVTMKAGKK